MKTTLPTDSNTRKEYPLFRGLLRYFPAALAGVSRISKLGNDKHNPGEEMHHARGKSMDHGDCVLRHLVDVEDLIAARERGEAVTDQQILDEADQACWRALAFSQQLHEKFGAPLAPGAQESPLYAGAPSAREVANEAVRKLGSITSRLRHAYGLNPNFRGYAVCSCEACR